MLRAIHLGLGYQGGLGSSYECSVEEDTIPTQCDGQLISSFEVAVR